MVTHEPDIARFARRISGCGDERIRKDESVAARALSMQALAEWPSIED